ncbi:MAG: hypothetical protein Q9184_008446 [Pyrenodesmia sp. 2 TL-2023]
MGPKDPRAYLIRSLQSKDYRVRRTKTSLLPLETPSFAHEGGEGGVKDLVQRVRVNVAALQKEVTRLSETETVSRNSGTAFEDVTDVEVEKWERTVRELVAEKYEESEEGKGVLEIDVADALGLDVG